MSDQVAQLIEYNTQDVIKFIVDDNDCSISEAMDRFYSSSVYAGLIDEQTGLYLESPSYLYELYLRLS